MNNQYTNVFTRKSILSLDPGPIRSEYIAAKEPFSVEDKSLYTLCLKKRANFGTSGLRDKDMKRSTLGSGGQRSRSRSREDEAEDRLEAIGGRINYNYAVVSTSMDQF